MRVRWRLRMAAAQREVWSGTELRRLLAEKAGLEMSAASVSAHVAVPDFSGGRVVAIMRTRLLRGPVRAQASNVTKSSRET
ncbi:hypothetical protein [Nocardia sp. NBC_01009]|uniref:hypothetical protein n=1 Tax=Nocardia sp. NBC_01009 TaxID=2975996 RepID=UPI003863A2AF|nr:hypothetical protein OHA42_22990 [Nocardia sp. NBC_01009]